MPRTWARVVAGDLQAWRARRIAQRTIALSREAAAYVDKVTAPFAHKTRPAELERTITTAIARYMPDEAEARQQAAADGRRFEIDPRHHDLNGLCGTADVYGTLDLADALDLEAAVAGTAATLKDLGSQDSLDVRRAAAVGEIARRQLALDLSGDDDAADRVGEHVQARPAERWSSTCTSPTPPSPAPAGSGTSTTSTSTSSSNRSAPGAGPPRRST